MSFVVKAVQSLSSKYIFTAVQPARKGACAVARRCFSTQSRTSSLIGPAPSQPILPGDFGSGSGVKSLELASKHSQGQGSIFSHADMAKLKNIQQSKETRSFLDELMSAIKQQNAEMQKISMNLQHLVEIIRSKNSP